MPPRRSATGDLSLMEILPTSGSSSLLRIGSYEIPSSELGGLLPQLPDYPGVFPITLRWQMWKDYGALGEFCYWVEVLPEVRAVWWPKDSDRDYNTKDLKLRALPFLEFFSHGSFRREIHNGRPITWLIGDGSRNAVYFSNIPIKNFDDRLKMAALKNVSVSRNLQGWFCLLSWPGAQIDGWFSPLGSLQYHAVEILKYAYHSTFNRSSEDHEGFSWWQKTKEAGIIDDKVWDRITKEDPSQILTIDWLDRGYTPMDVIDRIISGIRWLDDPAQRMAGYESLFKLLRRR